MTDVNRCLEITSKFNGIIVIKAMELKCDLCDFVGKTRQGLAGHRQFAHQLADKYAHARDLGGKVDELAQSLELLSKEKARLEQAIGSLRDTGLRLETDNKALESKRAGLHNAIGELEQLASIKREQIAASWRQGLIQAGWIPPGTVQPSTIAMGELVKWLWGAVTKKA